MRSFTILALAVVLAAWPATAAPAYAATLDGPAAFGARVVTGADGGFQAAIVSCGEKTGSTDGVGILLFDEAGAFRFGFGVTGHGSPDRTMLQLGDTLDDVEVTVLSYGPICPYSALTLTVGGAPHATHRLVMWAAGLEGATSFTVEGAGAAATVAVGDATARGDPELERAAANVQVQRRVSGFHGVGVKVVQDASLGVAVEERAFGFWGYNDAKFVCASACAGPATADEACLLAAGTTCTTRLSWQGPASDGAGEAVHTLLGEPAGAYTFRVDQKVDAYDPGGGAFVPPGVLVFPGENYSYLSLADVALP